MTWPMMTNTMGQVTAPPLSWLEACWMPYVCPSARSGSQVVALGDDERLDADGRKGSAHAGALAATPREEGRHAVAAVPVGGTTVHLGQKPLCARLVRAPHPGGEPKVSVIHEGQRLLVGRDGLDPYDRTERLVLHERHGVVHAAQHGRRVEAGLVGEQRTTDVEGRALGDGVVDLRLEEGWRARESHRPEVRLGGRRVAHLE
mmetsp:Transcript_27/g.46  ORF Transcript_27/g.46 Transcript_27/m.46 type:complete len:203 (+) Transcript_27:75-683(+)